jgi:formate dehydrogenase accessory protein FdhE
LSSRQRSPWQTEIERCARLYEGFSQAAPFVAAAYECVQRFFQKHPVTPHPPVDPQEAAGRFRAGTSLSINPPLPATELAELLKAICTALVEANADLRATARVLEERSERLRVSSPGTVDKQEVGGLFVTLVKTGELEQDLATFLLFLMLSSFYARQLGPIRRGLQTDLWREGHCPLCGGKPHYGLLRRDDGAKQLECWLCETRWVHTRIKCPFCNNEEQDDLGYFTVDDRELCRISFCRRCNHYLKIIDARKLDGKGDIDLTIHNLASLSHDLLARQEGFVAGSGLEWVNPAEIDNRRVIDKLARDAPK